MAWNGRKHVLRVVGVVGAVGFVATPVAACGVSVVGSIADKPGVDGAQDARLDDRSIAADSADANGVLTDADTHDATIDAGDASNPNAVLLGCAAPGLVAYWRMDEGAGTAVNDCSANALHGMFEGVPLWTAPGRVGPHMLSFDANGSVVFGNAPALNLTAEMTVSAWVKIAEFGSAGRVLSKGGTTNDRGWELNIEPNATATFRVGSLDGVDHIESGNVAVPPGVWLHLVGVFEPSVAVRLYINGIEESKRTNNIPATHRSTGHAVTMGRRPGDGCCRWDGEIDDVRLFNRVLSASEIAILATP